MKTTKRKNGSKVLRIILAVVAAVLVVEILMILFLEKREEPHVPQQTQAAQAATESRPEAETTEAVTEATELVETAPTPQPLQTEPDQEPMDGAVQTPYFTLYYPDAFSDHLMVVNTAQSPYVLEFYAVLEDRPEQRLFDVRLGTGIEGNMGMVVTDAGQIRVDLIFYEFTPGEDWLAGEVDTILAMQEAANDMMARLPLEPVSGKVQQPDLAPDVPDSGVVDTNFISTPYCIMQYPANWEDYLVTEQEESAETGVHHVRFYGKVDGREKCLLFTILFGGDEGEQLGAIMCDDGGFVTVNMLLEELDLSGWAEEDAQILYSMQESVNELISQLPLA